MAADLPHILSEHDLPPGRVELRLQARGGSFRGIFGYYTDDGKHRIVHRVVELEDFYEDDVPPEAEFEFSDESLQQTADMLASLGWYPSRFRAMVNDAVGAEMREAEEAERALKQRVHFLETMLKAQQGAPLPRLARLLEAIGSRIKQFGSWVGDAW